MSSEVLAETPKSANLQLRELLENFMISKNKSFMGRNFHKM